MLQNYFKIAWRNLFRNKLSSFINIGGLAVGMAVAMLIGLWIWDEFSFNKYHENYDCIVQVMRHETWRGEHGTNTFHPVPLGTTLRSVYGNNFKYVVIVRETEEHIITAGDKKFTQAGNYMQSDAPDMLALKMIYGTRTGLKDKNSILLSESLAKKLFGNANPLDKIVTIDTKITLKVTGVYEDLPNNSTFRDASFIAPFDLYIPADAQAAWMDWSNYNIMVYAQLAPNVSLDQASINVKDALQRYGDEKTRGENPVVFLHPMRKWHLAATFENRLPVRSEQLKFVWLYGMIGAFVLLLACINFMNLSTARSEKRAREVGIRKTLGAAHRQLIGQFFSESFLTVAFAFIIAIVLVELLLPWFNHVSDKAIHILWRNPVFWLVGLTFTFITGLLAGSYPALYLSSFQPVKVLKGTFRVGRLAAIPRKMLVVMQFTVSIALIIGTIIVYRQIQFVKNRPVGYSKDGLLTMQVNSPDYNGKYDILRTELAKTGAVTAMAESGRSITDQLGWNNRFEWTDKEPGFDPSFNTIWVSPEYGKTVGWEFVAGRDFSRAFASDSAGIVINESAAKLMGLENPTGEFVSWKPEYREGGHFKILGVTKDVLNGSPFEPANPSIFFMGGGNWVFIRINPAISASEALPKIEAVFNKILPSVPFDYHFVDEDYGKKFAAEERIGKLASFFAILAVFISCLGLFGLASFVAEQRTKEIGIRKVLGASLLHLWSLLSKEFILLVMIALLIATPLAYYFMNNWLQNYTYRADISWWIFASAGAGALLIALFTVSFQAIRAAAANPVKSLKTE